MPFIFIICINFYYFSSTIVYRYTGKSKLRDTGNISTATKLIIMSIKLRPLSSYGMKNTPDSIVFWVVSFKNAEDSQWVTISNPVYDVNYLTGWITALSSFLVLRKVIAVIAFALCMSSYLISLTLI